MLHLAYLDPGTGAIVFQAIAGAVLAVLFTFKLWFFKIKLIITGWFGRGSSTADTLTDAADQDRVE